MVNVGDGDGLAGVEVRLAVRRGEIVLAGLRVAVGVAAKITMSGPLGVAVDVLPSVVCATTSTINGGDSPTASAWL